MRKLDRLVVIGSWAVAGLSGPLHAVAAQRFEVTVAPAAHAAALTGRLIVVVSKREQPEPRLALSPQGPAMFGVDLDQVRPGQPVIVDDRAVGYPMRLGELPTGEYFVQALILPYERVRRADGHTIWVRMNDGTVEAFNRAAGNLYSDVRRATVARGDTTPVRIEVDKIIPAPPASTDSEWLKHVKIQSQKLTRFWGRPIYIHAHVLLPRGYADQPDRYYPSIYSLGHGRTPFSFTTTPSSRPRGDLNPVTGTESGYDFFRSWVSDGYPRVIVISLEQQTPYFPDSYSVNSANNGPYGDAIVEEVIPYLEGRFRIIRKPYARQLEVRRRVAGRRSRSSCATPTSLVAHGSSSPTRSTSGDTSTSTSTRTRTRSRFPSASSRPLTGTSVERWKGSRCGR